MEGSNQNQNSKMKNEKAVMFISETKIEENNEKNWSRRVGCNSPFSLIKLIVFKFAAIKEKVKGIWGRIWKRWNFGFAILFQCIIGLKLLYFVVKKSWISNGYYFTRYL